MIRKLGILCGLIFALALTSGCDKLRARDNLNKGIKAFKEQKYDKAAEYFDTSSKQDPALTNAKLYLATAYAQQAQMLDPNMISEESQQFANNAIKTFESVIDSDPKNTSAIAGLAGLYQGLKMFDKSKEYYRKQTEIDPENAVPYYAIASTNWMMIRDKSKPVTDEEKVVIVDEGLQYVDKALEKRPTYFEAMTYKNLLLRDKAAVTKDPAQAKLLLDEANVWFSKALEQSRANSEQKPVEATSSK
jgi:tetratricopeptide (TPR) repeat protein